MYSGGINTSGLICGYAVTSGSSMIHHGYFFQNEVITLYDLPGATQTALYAINDAGDFVGSYSISDLLPTIGFTSISGTIANIDVPNADFLHPLGINNYDQVAGVYSTPDNINSQGFFQDSNGAITAPIDYPGAGQTYLTGINDRSVIVGYYYGTVSHGLMLESLTRFSTLDVPGAIWTQINAVNNAGLVAGTCSLPGDNAIGFIARIR
jgi:hypothetical protein